MYLDIEWTKYCEFESDGPFSQWNVPFVYRVCEVSCL